MFFWLSFSNNMLDFIWHGLHFPTSLPGRQSFLYAFLVLVIAYEALLYIRELKLWQVFAAGGNERCIPAFLQSFYGRNDDGADLHMGKRGILCLLFCDCTRHTHRKKENPAADAGDRCLAVVAELVINYNLTGLDTNKQDGLCEKSGGLPGGSFGDGGKK